MRNSRVAHSCRKSDESSVRPQRLRRATAFLQHRAALTSSYTACLTSSFESPSCSSSSSVTLSPSPSAHLLHHLPHPRLHDGADQTRIHQHLLDPQLAGNFDSSLKDQIVRSVHHLPPSSLPSSSSSPHPLPLLLPPKYPPYLPPPLFYSNNSFLSSPLSQTLPLSSSSLAGHTETDTATASPCNEVTTGSGSTQCWRGEEEEESTRRKRLAGRSRRWEGGGRGAGC
eukprot:755682-Hanusia_phi.AAC.5